MRTGLAALLVALPAAAAGCGDSPTEPSGPAIAAIRVVDEVFRIELTTEALEQAARAAMNKTGPTIPNGRIVAGTGVNVGYSWHLEDVEFVEVTIELCDGRPSDVERAGTSFANGRYCPWGAEVISVE